MNKRIFGLLLLVSMTGLCSKGSDFMDYAKATPGRVSGTVKSEVKKEIKNQIKEVKKEIKKAKKKAQNKLVEQLESRKKDLERKLRSL